MSDLGPGPYLNEQGDWWVPVAAIPNRMKAAAYVRRHADPDYVIHYAGQTTALLTPHETGCDCGCAREVKAWHFREEWA